MHRRALTALVALAPFLGGRGVRAQNARKVYRIGVMGFATVSEMTGPRPANPFINALLGGLRELGNVYGEDFVIEPRGSDGRPSEFPRLAAELARLRVDVIVAPGPMLSALKQATSTIPIVMAADGDPVGRGYAQSLGHPGGNFTGMSLQSVELTAKRLALLKEFVPGQEPVAVLWDRSAPLYWEAADAAAREKGWKVLSFEIPDAGDIEKVFGAVVDARAGALLVFAAGVLFPHARRVADLAARSRLPAMYELRPYVEAGGLISYGADLTEVWRHAAVFVQKILSGANPADLAIEQPTKWELVVNARTARTLDIKIPRALLLQADQVIE